MWSAFGWQPEFSIIEIEHFSPTQTRSIPSGHGIHKSGFLKECKDNSEKFILGNAQFLISSDFHIIEAIHPNQYGLSDYRGGIITFSTDINAIDINKGKISSFFNKKIKSLGNRLFAKKKIGQTINKFNQSTDKEINGNKVNDYIGAFSIGNFFQGKYIDDKGRVFNEKSLTIEINGVSSEGIIFLAQEIAREFKQETVLVKDLNLNKIFLVNQNRTGNYNLDSINKKST